MSGGRHRRRRTYPILTVLRIAHRAGPAQLWLLGALTLFGGVLPTLSMLGTGALVGSVPAAVRDGFHSAAGHRLVVALVVVGGLYVVSQAVAPLNGTLSWSLGSRYSLALRETVSSATLAPTGISHLESPAIVDEIAVVEGSEARPWVRASTVPSLMTVVTSLVAGLGSAIVLAAFRWWAPVVLIVAWWATHRWVGREVATFTKSLTSSTPELRRAGYYRDLAMRPPAAKELRVFGLAGWTVDRYAREWLAGMAPIWRERRGHYRLMAEAVGAVAIANGLVLFSLGRAALHGDISLGALAVYTQAALGTMALSAQGDPQRMLREGAALAQRATELAARMPRPVGRRCPTHRDLAGTPERGIRFENVSFKYPGTSRYVLDGLDLFIPAGRSLAVVGTNGAGKTTLIKLLTRLYEPTSGRITVDGVDIADVDPAVWLERVGVIFQDFIRFELPARVNVGVGSPAYTDDHAALATVARQVGAEGIVTKLPRGWDTVLSRAYENGADLSGGEWQRMALARALLSVHGGASLLVLDEPTANLDVRAESELFDRVLDSTRGTTTVLVSHRLSSVRRVDRIVVIDRGRVAEQGSHDELMYRGGLYARMFELQASRFREEEVALGA